MNRADLGHQGGMNIPRRNTVHAETTWEATVRVPEEALDSVLKAEFQSWLYPLFSTGQSTYLGSESLP